MSAAGTARRVARLIRKHGETMTLSRSSEATTISLKGKRITGGSLDRLGNSDQQSFRVLIAPTELLASAWASKEPTAGGEGPADTLTVDDRARNVLDVRPRRDGDVVALYELEVAG